MALVVQFDFENNRKDTKVYSTLVMLAQKKLDINRCLPTTLLSKLAPRRPQQVPPLRPTGCYFTEQSGWWTSVHVQLFLRGHDRGRINLGIISIVLKIELYNKGHGSLV